MRIADCGLRIFLRSLVTVFRLGWLQPGGGEAGGEAEGQFIGEGSGEEAPDLSGLGGQGLDGLKGGKVAFLSGTGGLCAIGRVGLRDRLEAGCAGGREAGWTRDFHRDDGPGRRGSVSDGKWRLANPEGRERGRNGAGLPARREPRPCLSGLYISGIIA